jgi:hypothetical protein
LKDWAISVCCSASGADYPVAAKIEKILIALFLYRYIIRHRMTRKTRTRKNKRWPGMTQAADALGVSYGHLLMVVKGIRTSRSLRQRFNDFKTAANSKG